MSHTDTGLDKTTASGLMNPLEQKFHIDISVLQPNVRNKTRFVMKTPCENAIMIFTSELKSRYGIFPSLAESCSTLRLI